MATEKVQAMVIHSGGNATEYPILDAETYEALLSAILRITPLENTTASQAELIEALQAAVAKLQETDTESAENLSAVKETADKAQATAQSNTEKISVINQTITKDEAALADEIQRAKDVEGDISDLDTTVKDNLVAAINWLLTKVNKNGENIGTLGDLTTVQKDNLVAALNEIKASMVTASDITGFATTEVTDALSNKLSEDESRLTDVETKAAQNATDITQAKTDITTNKGSIDSLAERVDTIEGNENTIQEDLTALKSTVDTHTTEIGDLSTLTTTVKTDLVSAINEAAASGGSSGGDPNALAMLWGKEYEGNRTSTVTYNSDGNVSSISETGDGNTATRTYTYDSDGRITKEAVTGTTPDGSYTKTKELTYGDSGATKIVETYSKTLSDPTWAEIAAKIKSGIADVQYQIGDLFSETWDHYTSSSSHTNYTAPWQVDDFQTAELEDGSTINAMQLEFKYTTPFTMPFHRPEAFYACPDGLSAGTYNYTYGSTTYQFTLTQDVEVGGRLAYSSTTSSASTSTIVSYKADGKTVIESVSRSTGSEGTALGTIQDYARNGNFNGQYLAQYGNGRYKESHLRQWLNSDAASGEWWTPATEWDIVPYSSVLNHAGFLHGLPQEMKDVIIPAKVITYPATIYGSEPDITYDKVTMCSLRNMYSYWSAISDKDGEALAYWKNLNGTSSRWNDYAHAERKKYSLSSKTSAQYYWLRSACLSSAGSAACMYGSGEVNGSRAYYGGGAAAPLVNIGHL